MEHRMMDARFYQAYGKTQNETARSVLPSNVFVVVMNQRIHSICDRYSSISE